MRAAAGDVFGAGGVGNRRGGFVCERRPCDEIGGHFRGDRHVLSSDIAPVAEDKVGFGSAGDVQGFESGGEEAAGSGGLGIEAEAVFGEIGEPVAVGVTGDAAGDAVTERPCVVIVSIRSARRATGNETGPPIGRDTGIRIGLRIDQDEREAAPVRFDRPRRGIVVNKIEYGGTGLIEEFDAFTVVGEIALS